MSTPLLEVHDLVKHYPPRGFFSAGSAPVQAVNGVSFAIAEAETLGLVGESGCGKSTVGRAILRLEEPTAGDVRFVGESILEADNAALHRLRRQMQVVFQDPYSSLNPRMSVGRAIAEGMEIHRLARAGEIPARVAALMVEVGLDPESAGRYPHEFSGGQRQRIGIARALAVQPRLLVCDEPVSALDVSVQAQVVNLLADLQRDRRLAYLFIAHDLAVVRQLAHRIAVMYFGRIVELGPARTVIAAPKHPYTQALVSAVPSRVLERHADRIVLSGDPPGPTTVLPGCAFASRCFHPRRDQRCHAERPTLRVIDGHQVACHHAEES
ncbi:MAG: oligopeptide/dipeptide ABC transporter ATP-binding protein [Gemmatimonadota bacterium]|nr:oligopeptide/dipeptide ABC transporter ATP-binding protein [Gemmatimonadota bacterium]